MSPPFFQAFSPAPSFLRILIRLVRQSEKRVYLIVDGHPVHRSKRVRDWVDRNREQFSLYQLPG